MMKCPYCGKRMEAGMVRSPYEIVWIKGSKRQVFTSSELQPDALLLAERSFFSGSAVEGGLCRACHKLVVDLE